LKNITENNLKRISEAIKNGFFPAEALLLTSHENRLFASGFPSSAGALVITADKTTFITDFRYYEAASSSLPDTKVIMISRNEKYTDLLNKIFAEDGIESVGFEDSAMSCAEYETYANALSAKLVPLRKTLVCLRAQKAEFELQKMQKAQDITDAAFASILGKIKNGMTEKEIEAELIYELYRCGAEKLSFDPIVVSGPNGSLPHGHASDRKVCNGDFITMDFGVIYGGYCSDMTRTVALGSPDAEKREIYKIVYDANLLGLETARAGVMWRDVDKTVRDYISGFGYGDCFGHGLGHGLGIEIHESLDFDPERPGLTPVNGVVSVEPGIYLPDRFGIRIEDCVILKEGGNVNLTHSPKELICL
jgi:Xaa-Pro aminopeptidase